MLAYLPVLLLRPCHWCCCCCSSLQYWGNIIREPDLEGEFSFRFQSAVLCALCVIVIEVGRRRRWVACVSHFSTPGPANAPFPSPCLCPCPCALPRFPLFGLSASGFAFATAACLIIAFHPSTSYRSRSRLQLYFRCYFWYRGWSESRHAGRPDSGWFALLGTNQPNQEPYNVFFCDSEKFPSWNYWLCSALIAIPLRLTHSYHRRRRFKGEAAFTHCSLFCWQLVVCVMLPKLVAHTSCALKSCAKNQSAKSSPPQSNQTPSAELRNGKTKASINSTHKKINKIKRKRKLSTLIFVRMEKCWPSL